MRHKTTPSWQGISHWLQRVELFDATTITLPPKLADWAKGIGRSDQSAGLKLQLKLAGDSGVVKQIILTPATGPDAPYLADLLGDLAGQEGLLFVFDGGYWSLDSYHDVVTHGHDFVTKRGGNIKPQVIKDRPLPTEPLTSGYTILRDALVYLGDDCSQTYRMLEVRLTSGETITLLTSLLDTPADQICLLYRYR